MYEGGRGYSGGLNQFASRSDSRIHSCPMNPSQHRYSRLLRLKKWARSSSHSYSPSDYAVKLVSKPFVVNLLTDLSVMWLMVNVMEFQVNWLGWS